VREKNTLVYLRELDFKYGKSFKLNKLRDNGKKQWEDLA
jgi:hypothetical protein